MSCCQDLGQVLINDLLHRVLVISSIHTKCRNMESLLIMSHKIWLLFTNVWGLRWYLKNYGKYERVFQLVFLDLPIKIKKPRIDWDKNNFANTRIHCFTVYACKLNLSSINFRKLIHLNVECSIEGRWTEDFSSLRKVWENSELFLSHTHNEQHNLLHLIIY